MSQHLLGALSYSLSHLGRCIVNNAIRVTMASHVVRLKISREVMLSTMLKL